MLLHPHFGARLFGMRGHRGGGVGGRGEVILVVAYE